jgi:putative PIN family toxin of toxin-antitoxin system
VQHLVLDTNTAISGLLWGGTPGHLIDAAYAQQVALFTSLPLLAEFRGVICRDKFAKPLAARGLVAGEIFDGYVALCRIVEPAALKRIVPADPDDDHVLACAVAAKADLIVSGDKHLLGLGGEYQGIRIMTPAQAVQLIDG